MDNLANLQAVEARTAFVIEHIIRVAKKYPRKTLPERLRILRHEKYVAYVGNEAGTIALRRVSGFFGPEYLRIPLRVWDAKQESEIHKWVRATYWAHQNTERERRARERSTRVQKLRDTIRKWETELAALGE